ncbi:MAG: hypothetical protein ACREBQ_08550 [Nitrososphaerales archaeon]
MLYARKAEEEGVIGIGKESERIRLCEGTAVAGKMLTTRGSLVV